MKKPLILQLLILMMAVMLMLSGCGNSSTIHPQVTITMRSGGVIVAELYPEYAPNTVNSFISLVNKGFYDGLVFHRVIPGFMIQGGDPSGNGTGGPGYSIKGEFPNNDFTQNTLKHDRGVLSMARSGPRFENEDPKPYYNTAGSQFFIMLDSAPHLNNDYAPFGRVISGMEEVDRIATAEVDAQDKPLEDEIIDSITVDTFGVTYPEPETLPET